MTILKYHTSDRDRICKLCSDKIVRNTTAIVMRNVHVAPKLVDLHFHEGCFMRAIDGLKDSRGNGVSFTTVITSYT